MIEIHHKRHSNIIITEIHGPFTNEYFNSVYIPRVEAILKEFTEVNIVLDFNNNITGWTLITLFNQFKEYIASHDSVNRLAIVSDNSLLKWKLNFFQSYSRISTARFPHKDIEKAKAWLAIG